MSTRKTARTTILVPAARMKDKNLLLELGSVTKYVGGCTVKQCEGQWYDEGGRLIAEKVVEYVWWHEHYSLGVDTMTQAVINRLHKLGEECVMTVRYDSVKGERAHLLYAAPQGVATTKH